LRWSLNHKDGRHLELGYCGEITNAEFQDIRENMYFVPRDLTTFLFGNSLGLREGNVADPVDRLRADTDVGYVTIFWGIGLVGLTMSVGFYLAILGFAFAMDTPKVSGRSRDLIAASLFFLAGHAKEVHLFTRTGLRYICSSLVRLLFAEAVWFTNRGWTRLASRQIGSATATRG